MSPDAAKNPATRADAFEETPLTRQEYISAMVHFYRGEVARSNIWRQRLDNTTNWAVVTSAAMITFTFTEVERTHLLLLLSNFIILGFLIIEARRFRYFAVYRARVRMLEENFLLPIVTRNLMSPKHTWRELVAMDLDVPKFKNRFIEAIALRIRYNYFWVYSTIFFAWLVKTWMHPEAADTWSQFYRNVQVGNLPAWFILATAFLFYGGAVALFVWGGRIPSVREDEIHGYEADPSHWKM